MLYRRKIWQSLVPIVMATILMLFAGATPLQAEGLPPQTVPPQTVPAQRAAQGAAQGAAQVRSTPAPAKPVPAKPVLTSATVIGSTTTKPTTPGAASIKPDPDYLQGLAAMRQQAETEPNSPTNQALKDVLNQLFQPQAVQIPFRFITDKAGVKATNYAGNIYFSQGAVFINYNGVANDDHFATIGNKLYTWKTGATQGEMLKRFPGDTLAFVMYMIDPSAIMRSIYVNYLDEPQKFTVKSGPKGEKAILFKQIKDGFKGIRIQEKPFWLKGVLLEIAKAQEVQIGSLEIDTPIGLEAIPPELLTLPKGVKFKPSEATLRDRMTYL
jgi:hypothetical protein